MQRQTVDEELQAMRDREAIRAVIANYCRGVDMKDKALFLSLWEPDARWTFSEPFQSLSASGLQEIERAIEGIWTTNKETYHYTCNSIITLRGDEAESVSDVLALGIDAKDRLTLIAASYHDRFRRGGDGAWRFAERRIQLHRSLGLGQARYLF
ncbi:Gamma-hexachlorocyclohexane dehydrochlorinase [bacterium HR25]|jgi:uncharacterized protein (TIGR02246 family)|nr:Gamma-hexachlorocyclohexane dehydrochlorinase [bacterium HR25]